MGALIDEPHLRRVQGDVEGALGDGARLGLGGHRVMSESGGYYLEAAILDAVRPAMRVAREEVFGPVLAVTAVADEAEALRAGIVRVNTFDRSSLTTPFGGFRQSGFGRDRSPHAIEKYTDLKTIWTTYR
jgi:acyl-CoA reductase-like NAD-dependent aldehyde dehydrogenase